MERYTAPELDIIKFDAEDVITTSPVDGDTELPEK